jgi:anaerobic ribonucleoside-triphosphate reductase activating protein
MRYNKIRKMDISNGPGVRVSIFVQGCSFNCKNCFNPETHDFNKGKEFTYDTINKLLELSDKEYINGLSILGGEPLHEFNILGTIKLAKAFKEKFPDKTIWVWTGFLFENVINKDIFKYIDVLVDGRFEEEHKDIRLKYCGSTNQRVIDIQQSLKKNKVILYEKR